MNMQNNKERRSFNDHWDDIVNNFNFHKVHQAMTVLEWSWYSTDGVPNHAQLITEAMRLCSSAYEACLTVSSGGFRAEYNQDADSLRLSFTITEFDTYIFNY